MPLPDNSKGQVADMRLTSSKGFQSKDEEREPVTWGRRPSPRKERLRVEGKEYRKASKRNQENPASS